MIVWTWGSADDTISGDEFIFKRLDAIGFEESEDIRRRRGVAWDGRGWHRIIINIGSRCLEGWKWGRVHCGNSMVNGGSFKSGGGGRAGQKVRSWPWATLNGCRRMPGRWENQDGGCSKEKGAEAWRWTDSVHDEVTVGEWIKRYIWVWSLMVRSVWMLNWWRLSIKDTYDTGLTGLAKGPMT